MPIDTQRRNIGDHVLFFVNYFNSHSSGTHFSDEPYFPIAPATLKSWRSRKLAGPPYYRIGDRIVYKLSELYDFFEQNKVLDDSEAGPHAAC